MDSRQAFFQAASPEKELLVVKAKKMQNGRMEIMHADWILHHFVSEVIRFSVTSAAFYPSAGHPRGKRLHVMISPGVDVSAAL